MFTFRQLVYPQVILVNKEVMYYVLRTLWNYCSREYESSTCAQPAELCLIVQAQTINLTPNQLR